VTGLSVRGALCLLLLLCGYAQGPQAADDSCPPESGPAVQVLGSGGPIADDARASSAYLLWLDGRSRALIDFGGGAFLRFGEAGAAFEDLDFIGLSHFHTDHAADLPALLKSGYFSDRRRPLPVAGPEAGRGFPGLGEFLGGLLDPDRGSFRYLAGYRTGTGGLARLAPIEVPGGVDDPVALDRRTSDRFRVEALYVPHGIVPTVAFRLRVGDRRIVFASDQRGDSDAFVAFSKDADLLVMHMAIPGDADAIARGLHATPAVIGSVAAQAGARTLLLSHFMARSLRRLEDHLAEVRERFDGRIVVAEDLACLALAGD
jgi:ribonuclease BN (tRNA processing enzyme)